MRIFGILLLVCVSVGAAACGQKGPLVLPDARTKAPVPIAKPAISDDEKSKEKAKPAAGP